MGLLWKVTKVMEVVCLKSWLEIKGLNDLKYRKPSVQSAWINSNLVHFAYSAFPWRYKWRTFSFKSLQDSIRRKLCWYIHLYES